MSNKGNDKKRTWGDYLYYSYASLNALMSALNTGVASRDNTYYRVRAHAYKMYREGKWHINDLYQQNRSKLLYGGHCYYCGKECTPSELTADHVFPRSKGGESGVDNIILACKACNTSKGSMDFFEWHFEKLGYWPDTFLLTHYLKQIYQYSKDNGLLDLTREELKERELPFNPDYVPHSYPQPEYFMNSEYEDSRALDEYFDTNW